MSKIWLLILGMALLTYGQRLLPIGGMGRVSWPAWVRRGLDYVPVAVMSALIGAEFVPAEGWFAFKVDARLLAGVVAILLAWRTRNGLLTIIGGMIVFLLL
jgi:branched-subunit amino acid transport protein